MNLNEMLECYKKAPLIYQPSKYWDHLNEKNLNQLSDSGIDNFKRTVNLNYFNFNVEVNNKDADQFYWLLENTKQSYLNLRDVNKLSNGFERYNLFVLLLWEYARSHDIEKLLDELEEPEEGNPYRIYFNNKLISQDLANSTLEYYSVVKNSDILIRQDLKIAELGAGYGRNAYVYLKRFPNVKYFIIDIPPALYISQNYLSKMFPNRKIYLFNESINMEKIKDSDIIFLMPHQLHQLPDKIFDLFLTISTLHEMRLDQISNYLRLIKKLTSGYFYNKQWYNCPMPFEGITITPDDYVVPGKCFMYRTAYPQVGFFESLWFIE